MYTPKFNQVADRSILIEAMQAYSFAILFGPLAPHLNSPSRPIATHLPLVVKDEGEHGLLEGHFAKANPHWKSLAGRETLVVFPGPHSYVSPSLYAEELSVPTWNYIAVHAYGTLELVEDQPGKEALLAGLIQANEPAYGEHGACPTASAAPCSPESSASASPSRASKANSKSARTAPRRTQKRPGRPRRRYTRPATISPVDATTDSRLVSCRGKSARNRQSLEPQNISGHSTPRVCHRKVRRTDISNNPGGISYRKPWIDLACHCNTDHQQQPTQAEDRPK